MAFQLLRNPSRADEQRTFKKSVLVLLASGLIGCSHGPFAGTWVGVRVPSAKGQKMKSKGYTETKPTMNSTLVLEGNGTYTAKLQEVDYAGDWNVVGKTLTLTPKTYMGMERAAFPQTKKATSSQDVDAIYKPYVLEGSPDLKVLTHTDNLGVVTFSKQSD